MLIYAQRPDATACASLELWNENMNCWVNKGAQGIALIDEEGVHRSGLKYVFDVKDVHEARFIGHKPRLWRMEEEHKDYVIDSLEKIYGETDTSRPFENRIMELANRIASEMAPDIVSDQLSMTVEGSYLDGLDELNLEVRLQQTLAASIAYTVLERCGEKDTIDYLKREIIINEKYRYYYSLCYPYDGLGEGKEEPAAPMLDDFINDLYSVCDDIGWGFNRYNSGRIYAAVWVWRTLFLSSWGEHATHALYAMDHAIQRYMLAQRKVNNWYK